MKAFVTGGSGFIGRNLIRQLVARGDEVVALARSDSSAAIVTNLGATVARGDITNKASMRVGMSGVDTVFHLAAWYAIGNPDWMVAKRMNVDGTRNVLTLAHDLGIPRIVYTSSLAVHGNTQGMQVDESYYHAGPHLSEYDRSKWLAHYKVAQPLIDKGAPIVIVMPGAVYGPGDTSVITDLMRLFVRGLPVVPGPSTSFCLAHVDDVAAGHLLAADNGNIGESYHLAGPAASLGELVELSAQLRGKKPPSLAIGAGALRPFVPLLQFVEKFVPLPSAFSAEATRTLGATYIASAEKARRQLGWQPRPLQTGMLETLRWVESTTNGASFNRNMLVGAGVGAGAMLLAARILGRTDDDESAN